MEFLSLRSFYLYLSLLRLGWNSSPSQKSSDVLRENRNRNKTIKYSIEAPDIRWSKKRSASYTETLFKQLWLSLRMTLGALNIYLITSIVLFQSITGFIFGYIQEFYFTKNPSCSVFCMSQLQPTGNANSWKYSTVIGCRWKNIENRTRGVFTDIFIRTIWGLRPDSAIFTLSKFLCSI